MNYRLFIWSKLCDKYLFATLQFDTLSLGINAWYSFSHKMHKRTVYFFTTLACWMLFMIWFAVLDISISTGRIFLLLHSVPELDSFSSIVITGLDHIDCRESSEELDNKCLHLFLLHLKMHATIQVLTWVLHRRKSNCCDCFQFWFRFFCYSVLVNFIKNAFI